MQSLLIGLAIQDLLKRGDIPKLGRYVIWSVLFFACIDFIAKAIIEVIWTSTGNKLIANWHYILLGNKMAKESSDRITNDLFANEIRLGRPKSNPYSRQVQLKINKQKQTQRDKQNGLKRIELKVDSELFDALNELSKKQKISRSELINQLLQAQINEFIN